MCKYCVVDNESVECTCVCSTYMGKKFCEKCGHRIVMVNPPR